MRMLFPLATAINFFSITGLLIIAGLFGDGELAAEIAVTQGAITAIFLSLSANARNLVLSDKTDKDEGGIFYFRLIVLIPAAGTAFFLAKNIVDIPSMLVLALILRKSAEWFSELHLATNEKMDDISFAIKYILSNTISFLIVLIAILYQLENIFYYALYIWAATPIILSWCYFKRAMSLEAGGVTMMRLIPHLGSSTIIGVTTYVFRLLLIMLVGKIFAGQMFTAYALGGVVSSIYTYALGPTLMHRQSEVAFKALLYYIAACISLGLVILLLASIWSQSLLIYGIGFSLIASGLMLQAQNQRMHLLQVLRKDVFVPDTLINILFIASVPFAYYVFGKEILVTLFLWSAILHLLFYQALGIKYRIWKA